MAAEVQEVKVAGGRLFLGDCLTVLESLEEDSVDLVFGSPPYEARREYEELKFDLRGQDWVDWMVQVYRASLRVCKGLVAFVMEGETDGYQYSCAPALLMADLHRGGVCLRKPPIYHRHGIPGSGGPDWLANCWEWIVCATKTRGKLPWSDNTACGHPPKYGPGGKMTNRNVDGSREGSFTYKTGRRAPDGSRQEGKYTPPDLANPGNVIYCPVGGGLIGSSIAHDNEAPFPSKLADFFVRSFCPPGGVVLDPFGGSGTTAASAIENNRKFVTMDIRPSQVELIRRRVVQAHQNRGFGL